MGKLGILTFHNSTNYGAVLQSFALQKAFDYLGVDNVVLDYHCENVEQREHVVVPHFSSNLYHYLTMWKDYFDYKYKRIHIAQFIKNNIRLSESSYNASTIHLANNEFDAYVVGSDMVWDLEITGRDFTYFLDFANEKLRYSYAASMGDKCISDNDLNYVIGELEKYTKVSVRENNILRFLSNSLNTTIDHVLDPTLLFDKSFWYELEEPIEIDNNKDYILLYFIDQDGLVLDYAKSAAKDQKEIILISDKKMEINGCKVLYDLSVGNFLYLIDNANEIVTGSYHGLVFSLLFHKNVKYYCNKNASRINSLAELLQISSCSLIDSKTNHAELDYSLIDNKIDYYRKTSFDFLKKVATQLEGDHFANK